MGEMSLGVFWRLTPIDKRIGLFRT